MFNIMFKITILLAAVCVASAISSTDFYHLYLLIDGCDAEEFHDHQSSEEVSPYCPVFPEKSVPTPDELRLLAMKGLREHINYWLRHEPYGTTASVPALLSNPSNYYLNCLIEEYTQVGLQTKLKVDQTGMYLTVSVM